jgi:acyl-CoA thioester hydrolase
MDEAFMAYIDELGFAWSHWNEMGLGIYYVDSGCQFKDPAFFGERLNVHVAITALVNSSMTAEMTIVRGEDGQIVASGYIKGVLVDTATEKSTRIPDAFRAAVADYQGGGS